MAVGGSDGSVPRVSVVIPTLNRRATLIETINSVRGQDFDGPVEILVVDNASTDGTRSVLEGPEFADVRYLRHEVRIGKLDNLNFAVREARAEYVTLVFDDELMLQGNLREKVSLLDAHPEVVAVTSSVTSRDGRTGDLTAGTALRRQRCIEDRRTFLMNAFRSTTGGLVPVVMRSSCLESVRLESRDEPLDDNAMFLNLSRLGSIAILPDGFCTDTSGTGEMTSNGLLEVIPSRAEPGVSINVPGVWFYWSQYRLRMEHVVRSDDLDRLTVWRLSRQARRTFRVGVWKAVYHRLAAGQRPLPLAARVVAQAVMVMPIAAVPPVLSFLRWRVAAEPAPIPETVPQPATEPASARMEP